MTWVRRLLVIGAALDVVALLAFLVVYVTDRAAIADWVAGSPIYAGLVRGKGLDWTVGYATATTVGIHLVITALFLWLAVVVTRGRRATRIRATVMLLISIGFNAVAATSPVGGTTQQAVMGVAVAVRIVTLALLWLPANTRAFYRRSTGVRVPRSTGVSVDQRLEQRLLK